MMSVWVLGITFLILITFGTFLIWLFTCLAIDRLNRQRSCILINHPLRQLTVTFPSGRSVLIPPYNKGSINLHNEEVAIEPLHEDVN